MKDLIGAMNEEKLYIKDKLNGTDTSLKDRLVNYGYNDLQAYFVDKRMKMFNDWHPEVYYVDVKTLTTELENAIRNEKFGIYISTSDSLYAFHGSDPIDYELCDNLNVCVAELYHQGGTIIGSSADLGIEIVAPIDLGLDASFMLNKFYEIISKYIDNVTITGNDILVDGKKVMGSMRRNIGKTFIWAAQISFQDYTDIINKICTKQSQKTPSYIDSEYLTRDVLEMEVLKWLQKQ